MSHASDGICLNGVMLGQFTQVVRWSELTEPESIRPNSLSLVELDQIDHQVDPPPPLTPQ